MTLDDLPDGPLLVYGVGNPGRQDDGVGPMLVERLAEAGAEGDVTFECGYQLAPEDALLVSRHACVLFVDATAAPDAQAPYACSPIKPASEVSFTSHALSPGALLTLCLRLYGKAPLAFALAIPAYEFDVNADLTPLTAANLEAAWRDVTAALARRKR
jgi:hydrogenase maturation protease